MEATSQTVNVEALRYSVVVKDTGGDPLSGLSFDVTLVSGGSISQENFVPLADAFALDVADAAKTAQASGHSAVATRRFLVTQLLDEAVTVS